MNKCSCGKQANHTSWQMGVTSYFCCKCWVTAGHPPADWHSDCIKAFQQGLHLTGGSLPVLEEFSTPQPLSNLKADSNPPTRK